MLCADTAPLHPLSFFVFWFIQSPVLSGLTNTRNIPLTVVGYKDWKLLKKQPCPKKSLDRPSESLENDWSDYFANYKKGWLLGRKYKELRRASRLLHSSLRWGTIIGTKLLVTVTLYRWFQIKMTTNKSYFNVNPKRDFMPTLHIRIHCNWKALQRVSESSSYRNSDF